MPLLSPAGPGVQCHRRQVSAGPDGDGNKVLTEDIGHPEIKEAIDRLKQVRDLHLTSESLVTLGMRGIQLWLWGDF